MGIKIIKGSEKLTISRIKMLIYGSPGVGKTSLSFSSNQPICIDTDCGAYRSKNRQDTLVVDKWEDIMELIGTTEGAQQLKSYNTIVIDTVDKLLGFIIDHIRMNESSVYGAKPGLLVNYKTKALTMMGWGTLKNQFKAFLDMVTALNKDLILIAHEKDEKEGDNIVHVPAISGGSYDIVIQNMDMIGYMNMYAGKRMIDFNPSDSHFGKDAGGLGKREVADLSKELYLMDNMLREAKDAMGNVNPEIVERDRILKEYREILLEKSEASEFTELMLELKNENPIMKSIKWRILTSIGEQKGLKFDKESASFIAA